MRCQVDAIEKPVDEAALRTSAAALLRVDGMGCGGCATRVRNGLLSVPGVVAATVELSDGLVRVNFDPASRPVLVLLIAVTIAGVGSHLEYRASLLEATW